MKIQQKLLELVKILVSNPVELNRQKRRSAYYYYYYYYRLWLLIGGVPPPRWIVNFDLDLLDGLVIAAALGAYQPNLVSFR